MNQRVLFLCTHNSARSQMAQGLLNWLAPETYTAYSAGTHPSLQNPLAVKVMAELGINILDPAAVTGDVADRLQAFRNVRDGLYFQFWKWVTDQLPKDNQQQLGRVGEYD
jgi:protein-tyrosine-phosphatase